jgi:hypothetical protein
MTRIAARTRVSITTRICITTDARDSANTSVANCPRVTLSRYVGADSGIGISMLRAPGAWSGSRTLGGTGMYVAAAYVGATAYPGATLCVGTRTRRTWGVRAGVGVRGNRPGGCVEAGVKVGFGGKVSGGLTVCR